jgi:hypothetical protein
VPNRTKTNKTLYIVTVPKRNVQVAGAQLVAGRPDADAFARKFKGAKVRPLYRHHLSAAEDMAKTLNPYLPKPVAALWVVEFKDGEQKIFESAEEARECATFFQDQYGGRDAPSVREFT